MASLDVEQLIGLSAISITSLIAGYFTDGYKNVGRVLTWKEKRLAKVVTILTAIYVTTTGVVAAAGILAMANAVVDRGISGTFKVWFIRTSVNFSVAFLIASVALAFLFWMLAEREDQDRREEHEARVLLDIAQAKLTEEQLRTIQSQLSYIGSEIHIADQREVLRQHRAFQHERKRITGRTAMILRLPPVRLAVFLFPCWGRSFKARLAAPEMALIEEYLADAVVDGESEGREAASNNDSARAGHDDERQANDPRH